MGDRTINVHIHRIREKIGIDRINTINEKDLLHEN
jgi:hypothetical protein